MTEIYYGNNEGLWKAFFKKQTGGSDIYVGNRFQRGAGFGSFLRGLARAVFPVARTVAKSVGKDLLRTGINVGSDLLAGRDARETLKEHGKKAGVKLLHKGAAALHKTPARGHKHKRRPQSGGNLGRIRKKPVGKRPRARVLPKDIFSR